MSLLLRELGPEHDAAWDALAGSCPQSGLMQSSAWAAFKRLEGYATWRMGLFDGDALVGGASVLGTPGEAEGFLLCPEGPVLPWDDPEPAREGLRAIVEAARSRAERVGGLGLRIEPHLPPPAPSLLRNWTRAPVDLTPVHTLFVDPTRPDDELLAAMHPKARYNIRVAERHGVRVRRSTDMADISRFHALFTETAVRNGFFAEPYGFFLNLGAALFPNGQAMLLLAERGGAALAALLLIVFGRRATYLYGGSSGDQRHVMPNFALHWAAIHEARTRGCAEYDLYGYDPFGLPDHLYAGISRFKRQWGGARRDWMGARDYVFYDRLADRLAEQLAAAYTG